MGLGYEAAKDFSRRNGNVIIACRNVTKGEEAAKSIAKSTGNDNVECLELDLASLASVKEFITKIQSDPKYSSIDALVCNAGVWIPDTGDGMPKTKDGYEMHFGVNHLSHFLLATSLEKQLANSGDGRIVFVASSLMRSGKLDMAAQDFVHEGRKKVEVDEPGQKKKKSSFGPPPAYCDTKLMNALTCKHLSTILPPTVTTYSVCPGFCRSSLGRSVSVSFMQKILVTPVMLLIQRSAAQGAQNIVHATIEDKGKLQSGAMYKDGEVSSELNEYMSTFGDDCKKLFELSERLVQDYK